MNFIYLFIYLVLPVYCHQPISLHPRAHMLSHVIPWTSAHQTPLSMDFSGKNTGVGCHFLLHLGSFWVTVWRKLLNWTDPIIPSQAEPRSPLLFLPQPCLFLWSSPDPMCGSGDSMCVCVCVLICFSSLGLTWICWRKEESQFYWHWSVLIKQLKNLIFIVPKALHCVKGWREHIPISQIEKLRLREAKSLCPRLPSNSTVVNPGWIGPIHP